MRSAARWQFRSGVRLTSRVRRGGGYSIDWFAMKIGHVAAALTTRPYYSTEDVDEADARTAELVAECCRVCS